MKWRKKLWEQSVLEKRDFLRWSPYVTSSVMWKLYLMIYVSGKVGHLTTNLWVAIKIWSLDLGDQHSESDFKIEFINCESYFCVEVLLKWKLTVNKLELVTLRICILVKSQISGTHTPHPWEVLFLNHCNFLLIHKVMYSEEMFWTPWHHVGSDNRSQFRNDIQLPCNCCPWLSSNFYKDTVVWL